MLTSEDLNNLVAWTLIRAARSTGRQFELLLQPFSLTPQQFGVIAQLSAQGPMTQAELARAVLVTPQSMDALLTAMAHRQLVRRRGTGGRGRPNPVELTQQGAELLAEAWPSIAATNDLATLGLDHDASRQLNDWLLLILHQ